MRGINAGARELARSDLDALTELAKQHGAKGLVWAFVQDDEAPTAVALAGGQVPDAPRRSPPSTSALDATPGDVLLIVADQRRHRQPGARRAAAGAGASL